jgi:glycosyltransferase involved in cell wall biosynthesis
VAAVPGRLRASWPATRTLLPPVKLVVYTDYMYHGEGGRIFAERAFAMFLGRLAGRIEAMTIVGRLDPRPSRARYELPPEASFVPLPFYESLSRPGQALVAMARSLGALWRSLDGADGVWLLGPHPLALVFALLALMRGRRVFLGVRQDTPSYVRSRHPDRPALKLISLLLDGSYRGLARLCPTVVVGPDLARRYGRARRLLEITVSLISEADVVTDAELSARDYDGKLTLLSVGRLDEEKNPLMLAEVLAGLEGDQPGRWKLLVCGEGSLESELAARLRDRGVEGSARLAGYVPFSELREHYRNAHVLVSTSWTEGFPQVLVEAFAAGLPAVCTDVGGIARAAGDAVVLVPAGDVGAAVAAIRALATDPGSRDPIVDAARGFASRHTIEHEIDRLAAFLEAG